MAALARQLRVVFGKPRVLDISQSLDRNGVPFLVAHVGVRSTFLKNSYEPWLQAALWFALAAALAAMVAAGVLANVALRPLEAISARLEQPDAGGRRRGDEPRTGLWLEESEATRWCG